MVSLGPALTLGAEFLIAVMAPPLGLCSRGNHSKLPELGAEPRDYAD